MATQPMAACGVCGVSERVREGGGVVVVTERGGGPLDTVREATIASLSKDNSSGCYVGIATCTEREKAIVHYRLSRIKYCFTTLLNIPQLLAFIDIFPPTMTACSLNMCTRVRP